MTDINSSIHRLGKSPKRLIRLTMIGAVTALAWFSGAIPTLSNNLFPLDWSGTAYAQNNSFPTKIIWGYAAAVLEIEPIRLNHLQQANQFYGGNKLTQDCYQNNLTNEVNQICSSYKSQSAFILKKHGVFGFYNKITSQAKQNKQLRQRIQNAMTCQKKQISITQCF